MQGIEFETRESDRQRTATATEVLCSAEIKRSRHIPKSVRAEVWKRDEGTCVFVEPGSGRSCGSNFGLEWDHIMEFSKGGDSNAPNLRLLCRQHNNQRRIWEAELV
ncbi:MAG: HNH endonuclease [Bradymonadales bacterium]|nr:MAG: HNH endonuclease [Bradymonadales bacterium]